MRRTALLTKLNLHIALVALLLVFDLMLATRLLVAWHESHIDQSDAYRADSATYAQLRAQSSRLQALPAQLDAAREQAQKFIAQRIPDNDSSVLVELGALTRANHVDWSQAHYTFAPAIPGLAELRMEANVTGDYTSVMHFINSLERDKDHAFFIIHSITLVGQQGGTVNLRLRLSTYLRTNAAMAAALRQNEHPAGQEVQ